MSEPLRELVDAYRAAESQLEHARAALHDAIRAELAAGAQQVAVVRATGFTRETVRKIARASS